MKETGWMLKYLPNSSFILSLPHPWLNIFHFRTFHIHPLLLQKSTYSPVQFAIQKPSQQQQQVIYQEFHQMVIIGLTGTDRPLRLSQGWLNSSPLTTDFMLVEGDLKQNLISKVKEELQTPQQYAVQLCLWLGSSLTLLRITQLLNLAFTSSVVSKPLTIVVESDQV